MLNPPRLAGGCVAKHRSRCFAPREAEANEAKREEGRGCRRSDRCSDVHDVGNSDSADRWHERRPQCRERAELRLGTEKQVVRSQSENIRQEVDVHRHVVAGDREDFLLEQRSTVAERDCQVRRHTAFGDQELECCRPRFTLNSSQEDVSRNADFDCTPPEDWVRVREHPTSEVDLRRKCQSAPGEQQRNRGKKPHFDDFHWISPERA